jgi:pimeloyl-ACP methyl ester carboxylesterase
MVLQLLDYCGVKKALLVGYDWGGGIACAFGLQHPNRMSKLLGWCVSYRNIEELKPLQRRGKQGDVCIAIMAPRLKFPYKMQLINQSSD